ncbi:MAG TPA: tetratricopeptide repeat protein [Sedimentisphaerales bacterium]|nr:tetratricopeptide repeat protein [Sedimentisphaerales bacterium]
MKRRYFNWKLASVLVIGFFVLAVTAYGLRQWQKDRRAERGLVLGNKAYEEHRWEDAARYLGRYLAAVQDDVPVLLKYADAQLNIRPLKRDDVQQATTAYRIALRVAKNNSEACKRLIEIYLLMGMPGEAELIAERYLEENHDPELQRILAVALARQRKFDEAAAALKAVVTEHPDHVAAYETLSQLVEQRPEAFPDPPIYWLDEAIKNNPSSALAYIIRAGFRLRNKDRLEALTDLAQAETLDLSDPIIRLRLAQGFIGANLLDKAEQHLALAEAAEPSNQVIWQTSAELALKSQSKTKMAEVAEKALKELSSQPWDFMPIAAELFIRADQYDRAADCIGQLRQKDIEPAGTAFLEGLVAERKGQTCEAVKCWRRAMELGNKSPQTRSLLASALSRLGDAQSALRQLRTLVSERPNLFEGRLALGRLLAQTANWAEAAEQAQRATQLSPENHEAALLYLQTRMQLLASGATGKNTQIWQQIDSDLTALEKVTNHALDAKVLRVWLLMQQGNFAGAEALAAELKKAYPSQIKVAMVQAELLAAQNKQEQAVLMLNNIVREFPKSAEPVEYLAILLTHEERRKECQEVIEDALARIDEPSGRRRLQFLLADLYDRWGQQEKAYELIASLAREFQDDIPAKRRLLRCEQIVKDLDKSQKIIDEIRSIEGENGWQWRYEQAKLWFVQVDFKDRYPQIISLLQENLLANPDDQASRALLAAAYERAGELQLAISTYRDALSRSPDDLRVIIPAVAVFYKAKEYDQADEILKRASQQKLYHPQLERFRLQGYLRRGQLGPASDILQDFLNNDPNNSAVCLSLALLKTRQGEFSDADALLAQLRAQEPNSLPVRVAQVELNVRQGKSDDALLLCNEIVNKSGNASAYILRGRTYAMLGRPEEAIKDFEYAAVIEPNNVETWTARSDFYRYAGQVDKASADIQQALSLAPDSVAIQKRAISLFSISDNSDLVRQGKVILDEALISHPDDAELQLFKARLLLGEGTAPAAEKATEILRKLAEDQPRITEAWAMLGEISMMYGDLGKAMDYALRGLAHTSNDKTLLLLKARVEAASSPASAIATLNLLCELDPNDLDIAVRRADTYIAAGQPQKAVNVLKKQLSVCDVAARRKCNIALAAALYKSGNELEAQKEFDSLYASEPNNPGPLLAQARLLKDDKLWDQLKRKALDWYENHPEDIRTPVAIARELTTAEDPQAKKEAEDVLRKILEREPDSLPAMTALAILLQMTGRSAESAHLYERILKLRPDNVVAINNLAWIVCEQQGKHLQALELVQRGLEKAPDYIDLIDTRGVTYYRLGKLGNAIQDFDRCIRLYPPRTPSLVASYFHLGRALMSLGQKDKAVENLKKAFEMNTEIGGLSPSDMAEARRLIEQLSKEG